MTRLKEFASRWAVIATVSAVVAAPIVVGAVADPPGNGSDFCREDVVGTQAAGVGHDDAIRIQMVGHVTLQPSESVSDSSENFLACASPGCRWFPRGAGCNVLPENE